MNKILKFDLNAKSVKVKKLLNEDFLEVSINAISTAYPNRNNSHFTKEALENAIQTFYNKPILGSFSVSKDDFRGHESGLEYDEDLDQIYYDYTDEISERPLGLIRQSDKVEVYHNNKDGLDWIRFTCAIWVKYNYKQVKSLLKSPTKKISVEIEVNDYEIDEKGIEIIKDFTFDGVTILSDKLETGIADAKMTILDLVDDSLFQKKQKALAFAYKALDEAQGVVEIPELETQDSNKEDFIENPIDNEAPASEIEMDKELNQEGGEVVQMNLTMQAKIQLLEAYLKDAFNDWVWVCDLDEEYVYFSVEADEFRATYSITLDEVAEGEEQTGSVEVDVANRERVVRAWKVFEAEEVEEAVVEEAVAEETFEVVDEAVISETVEAVEEAVVEETFVEETSEVETVEDTVAEETFAESEETVEETVVDEVVEEFACEEGEEECKLSEEECKLSEEEPEDECKMSEEEPCEEECKFEDGEDCDDCDDCEEFEIAPQTVEVDGETLDIFALFAKYNSLKEQVNELSSVVKTAEKEKFIKVGEEFINADEFVDEETKANFVSQITAKCEAEEFTTEEDVRNFAKSLLAMYYYENQSTHTNKSNDFSIEIENQAKKTSVTKDEKLRTAISKLNRI